MQSVTAIRRAIEQGERTPRDTIAAALDGIAAAEAGVGAFEYVGDRDLLLAAAGRSKGPLAGIAVGVKDIIDTHDMPTGHGTPIHAGHQPATDAAIVAMLRRAGATIVGKTVTTPFAFLDPAGTRNPLNPHHTPGGSSSGSAAAVAAGMVPAAIGTQTGGSVIRPAAFCGVSGYKPSFRLVPTVGCKTFSWTLDTVGFFAAKAEDVAALAAAATGRALTVEPLDGRAPRIGIYRSGVWGEASTDMQRALSAIAERAARAGATVTELAEPAELTAAREVHGTIQNYEAALALSDEFDRFGDRMSEKLVEALQAGRSTSPEQYDQARRIARRARTITHTLFENVDVLLAPSAPDAAPAGLDSTGSPIFAKLWTLTGNPCVNFTAGYNGAGLPLGVQVVGAFGKDRTALSAAHWLEKLP
jgi:Asp-tRNA(Asn)/Glu-tRNA(Gln) amidotransferase A subunit family amidase